MTCLEHLLRGIASTQAVRLEFLQVGWVCTIWRNDGRLSYQGRDSWSPTAAVKSALLEQTRLEEKSDVEWYSKAFNREAKDLQEETGTIVAGDK